MFWSFRTYANGLTPMKPKTFLLIDPMKKYMWLSHRNILYLCLCESSFAHHRLLLTTVRYGQNLLMFWSFRRYPYGLSPIKPNTFLLIFPIKKYMWVSHCNLLYLCLCGSAFAYHCLLLTTVRYSQILFLFRLLTTHPNGLTPIRPNTLLLIRPIKKYMWLSYRNKIY